MSRILIGLVGMLGCVAVSGSAWAAQLNSWDFSGNTVGGVRCNNQSYCIYEAAGGYQIKVSAYSTSLANTNNGSSITNLNHHNAKDPAGKLTVATLSDQGTSGLGIKHSMTGDTGEGTSPEHAADNNGRYDAFVLEAIGANADIFDWGSITLGWAQEFDYGTSGTNGLRSIGNRADLSFFAGNGNGTDFTNICLSTCTNGGTSITSAGFSSLGTVADVTANTAKNVPGSQNGRFLVVSGALNLGGDGDFDAFKLKSMTGVPEPGAIALLGIGLVALGAGRRSRAVRA
jgi:hypothetical protein